MSGAFTIRTEEPGDYAGIERVNRLAFGQDNEARLVAAIRAAAAFDPSLSLVAVCAGEVVGHILFSPIHVETEAGEIPALALAPMAVVPDRQRQEIGSQLVRGGLDAAGGAGHGIVIVVGHAAYYPRFGFTAASRFGLRAPFDVPDEAFMAIELTPGALTRVTGTVRYPAAFDEV